MDTSRLAASMEQMYEWLIYKVKQSECDTE